MSDSNNTKNQNNSWTPSSWRPKTAMQQPVYDDTKKLEAVLNDVKALPPLVFVGEILSLRDGLARAGRGETFLLQGGDCAERFQDCNQEAITRKIKILLQMSVVLCYGARKPILRVGRIAGQYAKPRSNPSETVNGQELPVYRGDIINAYEATLENRTPDPERIKTAYLLAATTLNYIRALTKGGFADLHHPQNWDLAFVDKAPRRAEYENIVADIQDAILFMESLGSRDEHLASVEFYTSHEGLLLPLEESLTEYSSTYDCWYNRGAHMLWIGDRTRQLDGAHIEYFRGIANPIGLKVGPKSDPREIIEIVKRLNPNNVEGKLTLISRYGKGNVSKHLPKLIEAVQQSKRNVVWSIDPMHGNGETTESGVKTRNFDSILSEVKESFEVHRKLENPVGGIHFELTGDDVTECMGGSAGITAGQLDDNYESYCDPRLNYSQSLEMAFLVSRMLEGDRKKNKK